MQACRPSKACAKSRFLTFLANVPSMWVCRQCQLRLLRPQAPAIAQGLSLRPFPFAARRRLSSSRHALWIPSSAPPDPDHDLPSAAESRRSAASKRVTHLLDSMQTNLFRASQRLNDLTGYSGIEALKQSIERQEAAADSTKTALAAARDAYAAAISQRSASQREVNELLQRKHAWSAADLERFTALYRSDHANEQAETQAREGLAGAERAAEDAATRLGQSILARYHEEQIWSDKIRRMSTWGTWGLMGVNVLLFVVFQVAVEPWRRKRLVKGFEEKVAEALDKERTGQGEQEIALLKAGLLDGQDGVTTTSAQVDAASARNLQSHDQLTTVEDVTQKERLTESQEPLSWREVPLYYKQRFEDLFSERVVTVKRIDLTTATLEGAIIGVALTSVAAAVLRGR